MVFNAGADDRYMSYKRVEKERTAMKTRWVLIVLAVLFFCAPVQGGLYKYRDENGVLRFTDDISRVPPDQRSDVEAYEEVVSEEIKSVDNFEIGTGLDDMEADAGFETEESGDLAELRKMNEEKKQIDREYAQLVREKEELVRMKKDIKTQDELRTYNEKIVDLNDRIFKYEVRRKAFAKEVEAFNKKMGQ